MEKTLQRLGEVDIIPPPGPSKFVAPQTVMYHLDGTLTPSPSFVPGRCVARNASPAVHWPFFCQVRCAYR